MKPSTSKWPLGAAVALTGLVLSTALASRLGGTNWAAGVATVLGICLWLWSARRSYREQARELSHRLIVDRAGEPCDEERPRLSIRRIRVANGGNRLIQQVEVTLAKCGPAPAWFEPVRLQRMQGGPHPFDLPAAAEVYIDLVALPQAHPEFIIVHDSSRHGGLPNGIAIQPLELTIRVTAHDLPSVSLVFEASRRATGELTLVAKTR